MSFSQSAYSNINDANEQLQAYFTGLVTSRAWNPDIVDEINVWVQATKNANTHWYGDDVQQFWIDIANGYRPIIDRLTDDDPSILNNWDGVGRVFGADVPAKEGFVGETVTPASIAYDTEQATGVTGAVNIAVEEIQEIAERQAGRTKKWQKIAPFALPVLGLAGLYVVIKAAKPF